MPVVSAYFHYPASAAAFHSPYYLFVAYHAIFYVGRSCKVDGTC